MEASLCSNQTEIRCAQQIPSLAAWVIEYAWSHRMMDILEGLVPCERKEGEPRAVTLEDPCSLRVAAAQAWSVVNTRDVKHFESVLELLESIYTLVPRLVAPIKHMKIIFGLKTMIVMWMLQKNDGEVCTMRKIIHFFPSSLSSYQGCSKKELNLMKKSHYEFKQLAQTLLYHTDARKAYIRDQMEEHYGERYAQKLEERLFDYLQLLEKELAPTTCIDQVLKQERPLVEGEQFLLEVLSCSPHCMPAVLKRLLSYAKAIPSTSPGMSQPLICTDKERQTLHPPSDPKDRPKWTSLPAGAGGVRAGVSHGSWKGRVEEKGSMSTPLSSKGSRAVGQSEGAEQRLRKRDCSLGGWSHGTRGHGHEDRGLGQDERGWGLGKERQSRGRTTLAEQHCHMGDYPMQLCTRHQRWVRNILQECSEELGGQSADVPQEYHKEVGCQTVNIMEHCLKEVGCQTVSFMEQCLQEVGCQTVSVTEKCSQALGSQHGVILKQYHKEVSEQSVSTVEQCPMEVGCQTVHVAEQGPEELEGHAVNILEQCSQEVTGQCPRDYSEAEGHDQGTTELQQVPPLTSPQPASPPHRHHSSRSYQACSQVAVSSLSGTVAVGLGIRISLVSQLLLIQSQMLQPAVRVRRLTQRECRLATGARGTRIRLEEEEEGRVDEQEVREELDEREEEEEPDDWQSDFSYSESDSGSDSDSEYNPKKKWK